MNTLTKYQTEDGRTINWPFNDIVPRDVQLEALQKGFAKTGFAYFMRQRLGKTWTAFAEYTSLKELDQVDWFIVITPNSLKGQWTNDIETADLSCPVCIYDSSNKKKVQKFFKMNKSGGAFLINYESVKSFLTMDIDIDFSRAYIVADESTRIKDPSTKSSKACIELADKCKFKRVMTGRPTSNSNNDIWAQLRFIGETKRNFFQHKFTFCLMGGYQGTQVIKNINTDVLQNEMESISYIASDKYIKGFNKVYEPMRPVKLSGRLLEMYKKMEDELVIYAGNDDIEINAPIVLVQYLRLQQISSGIAGAIDGEQHNLVEPSENPRIRQLKNILQNECTNKTIIVCRFRLSIRNVYDELTKEGYNVSVLNGNMRQDQIEYQKKQFNEGKNTIMIAQTSVLSFGHTLCGQDDKPCDSMIFYENDFSLINRAQCEARPEKYGRDAAVSYYDLYASKMDKYIISTLIKKEDASLALMKYSREYGMKINDKEDC